MKTLVAAVAALSLILVVSCSKKDKEDTKKTPNKGTTPAKTTDKTTKTTEVTKTTDKKTKAPAPVKKPDEPLPKASKFGPFSIVRCTLDGAPMLHESFAEAIRGIAAAAGVVFVVDHEGSLRRYAIKPGAGCSLTLDKAFGDKGVFKHAKDIDAIAVDSKGTLYVASDQKLLRYADNKLQAFCKATFFATESMAFSSDDSHLFANGFREKMFKVEIKADSCKSTDWTYKPKLSWTDIDVIADRVVMTGKANISSNHVLLAFAAGGGDPVTTFDTGKKLNDDQFLCNSGGAVACAKGVCVVDSNCRAFKIYGADGKFREQVKFQKSVFGGSNVWIPAIDMGAPDVAFMAVSVRQPKSADGKAVNKGFVFRVSGLAAK